MIEVKNISFKYSGNDFRMEDISLSLEEGYINTIIGENGCGKTTLLKLIYGMLTPKNGEILWNGKSIGIDTLPAYHREVAFVGGDWCIPDYSIRKNMEILSTLYPDYDKDLFDDLIKKADLSETEDTAISNLSKGQTVKAEIIFNLAKKPKMLILDEPLANLDPVFKVDILEIIQNAVASEELGVIMSTNLLDEVKNITDFAGIMKEGKMIRWGDRFTIFENK